MKKGQIVLLPFPFADFSDYKLRPVLCLTDSSLPYDQVVIAAISSKTSDNLVDTDILIEERESWFSKTGLKKTSVLKAHKLLTVEKSYIKRELGVLPNVVLKGIYAKLHNLFSL